MRWLFIGIGAVSGYWILLAIIHVIHYRLRKRKEAALLAVEVERMASYADSSLIDPDFGEWLYQYVLGRLKPEELDQGNRSQGHG
jgi:hypothetical protein